MLFQLVRCAECGTEALLRSRFARHEFTSIEAIETRVLDVIHRPVRATCASCEGENLTGTGSRHIFLMYSERADAHLAFTLRLRPEDDGRVKVLRQVWLVPKSTSAVELEHNDDERLDDFWLDSQIRSAASADDAEDAVEALEMIATAHPNDAILLRELGHCLMDAGRAARALGAYELSLQANRDQPEILQNAGRLYVSFGDPQRGAELLLDAWRQTGEIAQLQDVIRATYRGRSMGALEAAGHALLEEEGESLIGLKAIAAAKTVHDVGAMLHAWERLRDVAQRTGDRGTERVGAFWASALAHPIPDWNPGVDIDAYRRLLADELRAMDYDVIHDPEPLSLERAAIPVDIEAHTPTGERLLFVLFDQMPNPVLEHRLMATARAARSDERRRIDALIPISFQGLTYSCSRWVSGTPDAELLLLADADTTMTVIDENVAAIAVSAERHFGRPLLFNLDSLREIDAILMRLYDDGFGEITYAFQCQVASYVGQVIASIVEGTTWADGEGEMDPRVLELPGGEQLNLISKVRRAVINGHEDSLYHFVTMVLSMIEVP